MHRTACEFFSKSCLITVLIKILPTPVLSISGFVGFGPMRPISAKRTPEFYFSVVDTYYNAKPLKNQHFFSFYAEF